MSLLSEKIEQVLNQYDQRKGFFRYLFVDHPAIQALRRLTPADQNNFFKIYQCFAKNLPKKHQASYFVFKDLMQHFYKNTDFNQGSAQLFQEQHRLAHRTRTGLSQLIKVLDFLARAKLTTKSISNLVTKNFNPNIFPKSLQLLNNSKLLTQKNLDDIGNISDVKGLFMALHLLSESHVGSLTQEELDLLKVSPNLTDIFVVLTQLKLARLLNSQNLTQVLKLPKNNFLFTNECYRMIWGRIPSYLLIQAIFERLTMLSLQENPEQHLNSYINQLLGLNQNRPFINNAQSTHRASVHQSVSDSASKLFKLYSLMIEGNRLQDTLQMIHDYIMQLPEGSIKNTAAKNGIERIIHLTFTDPGSNLTIPQLLALSFLAIHDKGKRIGDLSDAREQFVEALYEIQPGYNLSESGNDRGGSDKPICSAGTFNKLIEKLEGIHSDVKVLYISPATASLKLPIVVRDAALDYLSSIAQPQTIEGLRRFTQLIEQIRQEECVEAIWDHLKPKIVDRMFAEFGTLYTGKADPQLIKLVEAGQYLKLEDLSRFQEQIMASPGYKHYCSEILRYSLNFFSQPSAQEVDSSCSARFSFAMSRRAGS